MHALNKNETQYFRGIVVLTILGGPFVFAVAVFLLGVFSFFLSPWLPHFWIIFDEVPLLRTYDTSKFTFSVGDIHAYGLYHAVRFSFGFLGGLCLASAIRWGFKGRRLYWFARTGAPTRQEMNEIFQEQKRKLRKEAVDAGWATPEELNPEPLSFRSWFKDHYGWAFLLIPIIAVALTGLAVQIFDPDWKDERLLPEQRDFVEIQLQREASGTGNLFAEFGLSEGELHCIFSDLAKRFDLAQLETEFAEPGIENPAVGNATLQAMANCADVVALFTADLEQRGAPPQLIECLLGDVSEAQLLVFFTDFLLATNNDLTVLGVSPLFSDLFECIAQLPPEQQAELS